MGWQNAGVLPVHEKYGVKVNDKVNVLITSVVRLNTVDVIKRRFGVNLFSQRSLLIFSK